jgi:hypothetical protein
MLINLTLLFYLLDNIIIIYNLLSSLNKNF